MSHLDAALRRAAVDGALKRLVTERAPQVDSDSGPGRREFAPEAGPPSTEERRPRVTPLPWDRKPHRAVELNLPPEVMSQLGNLVESLTLHPAAPRILGFASPGRGEGTSTCLATLGAYLASRHARVLMVDANQHHPALHTIANTDAGPGLVELVTGEIDMETAPRPTAQPDLFLLTYGTQEGGKANGVLVPSVFRERLVQYASVFDFVLVDCPPLNVYGDAAGIAGSCQAVILVIDGSRTRREAAQSSKALLERANCSVLGVFMNKRRFYIPGFLYNRL